MTVFYWVMGVLVLGSFVPSVLFLVLYAATGDDAHGRRAKAFWTSTRLFGLSFLNLLVWGHVAVGVWQLFFR